MTGPRHADRPEHVLHPDELEVAPGTQHESLQGWIPELATEEELRDALEKAFDYRGDVAGNTKRWLQDRRIHFRSGYGEEPGGFVCAVLPKESNQRVKITYSEIAALAFTGRDTAAGKSWEAWVKNIGKRRKRAGKT